MQMFNNSLMLTRIRTPIPQFVSSGCQLVLSTPRTPFTSHFDSISRAATFADPLTAACPVRLHRCLSYLPSQASRLQGTYLISGHFIPWHSASDNHMNENTRASLESPSQSSVLPTKTKLLVERCLPHCQKAITSSWCGAEAPACHPVKPLQFPWPSASLCDRPSRPTVAPRRL